MSKPKSFVTRIQAEGTFIDKKLVRDELNKQARELAAKMPIFGPDRLIYVRNLTYKTIRKELDLEVFKEFVKITNSWVEVETVAPRAKLLATRGITPRR